MESRKRARILCEATVAWGIKGGVVSTVCSEIDEGLLSAVLNINSSYKIGLQIGAGNQGPAGDSIKVFHFTTIAFKITKTCDIFVTSLRPG